MKSTHVMSLLMCFCLAYGVVVLPRAVDSQFAVIDAAHIAETVLQTGYVVEGVAHEAEQVVQLATQIDQLAQQIAMMLINLEDISDVVQLIRRVEFSLSVMSRTRGIPYAPPRIVEEILKVYPYFGVAEFPGLDVYRPHVFALNQQTWRAVEDAMVGQAMLDQMGAARDQLDVQVAASRGAVGNLSATKATNELLALQTTQIIGLQHLQAMSHRVLTSQLLQQTALNDMERAHLDYLAFGFAPETLPGPVFSALP